MQQAKFSTPIPPADLRLGIGPFDDPDTFVRSGHETIQLAEKLAHLNPSQSVLDVGCGCGRLALPLTHYLSEEGRYTGFDPNKKCINWCTDNVAGSADRFEFVHVDLASDSYNPSGSLSPDTFNFPNTRAYDLVLLSSVITHLYPDAIENYFRNIAQVLSGDGYAFVSVLIMDEEAHRAVETNSTIFDFTHRVGDSCWTFDPIRPLDGIACDKDWLLGVIERHGLYTESLHEGNWRMVKSYDIQHDWIAVRRAA